MTHGFGNRIEGSGLALMLAIAAIGIGVIGWGSPASPKDNENINGITNVASGTGTSNLGWCTGFPVAITVGASGNVSISAQISGVENVSSTVVFFQLYRTGLAAQAPTSFQSCSALGRGTQLSVAYHLYGQNVNEETQNIIAWDNFPQNIGKVEIYYIRFGFPSNSPPTQLAMVGGHCSLFLQSY